MRVLLLGNPENRRVTLFQEALSRAALPPAEVCSWLQYLDAGRLPFAPGRAVVRIDSWGENFEVARRFFARAGVRDELVERRGEVFEPKRMHDGCRAVLEELGAELAARPSWELLNLPSEIDELFDKRRTSRRYRAEGIPVPEFLEDPPDDPAALLEQLRQHGWTEAFVKLSSGSSASCLAHVALRPRGVLVTTSLEWDAPRWFNTLKVRRLQRPADVDRALGYILSQGAQVERGVPKARLGDAFFDLRVLCIEREPRFVVVRQSALPITNLHLGGVRGDLAEVKARMPDDAWDRAMETCRRVAGLYRSLHLGIDLLIEEDFVGHRVLEVNAFGDLLPNLLVDGRSVWDWEVEAARARLDR